MNKIITHHKHFHLDEVIAIALLDIYYFDKNYEVIRTRDEDILDKHKNDENVFVIDVGFDYNPEKLNFDHHQGNLTDNWHDGTPYSSCGLIWKFLRDKKILNQHMNHETMDLIESQFIKRVDMQDNGIERWPEASFISLYNRKNDNDNIIDKQFKRAVDSAKDFYINFFYDLRQKMTSTRAVKKSLEKSKDIPEVVVLDSNLKNAGTTLAAITDKKLMVVPRTKNSWMIKSIPLNENDPFSMRCSMPKEWLGKAHNDLQKHAGIEGLIFCHKKGFMCMFEGSKDDAIKLARFIILKNDGLI